MDYVNAFWAGGLICALVQILLDRTKLMPGRVVVLLVTSGTLLGFGNTLFQGVKEAVQKDGLMGIFRGGFTASAAGISAALVFSYLASWIFEPKMKK